MRLLESSRKILEVIGDSAALREYCSPLLLHPDLHARNIFVDPNNPTEILGVIDWQSAAIEPAFVHAAETPDFAEEPLLDRTLDADVLHGSHELQEHARRCKKTWTVMISLCPKLGKASTLNTTLCRYLANISLGCSNEPILLRSLLTDVSNEWSDLELPGTCAYQPSQEEVKSLSVELDHSESTQRLQAFLSRLLGCETDGWVEKGRWDDVFPIYREQYAEFVNACIESREQDETVQDAEEKANKLWPFDLR